MQPTCPYCYKNARLVTGAIMYPHRKDLAHKQFYHCEPCHAWVGCHPGGTKPLGRLANLELRRAKIDAHTAFDPLWRTGFMKRKDAYTWLSGVLGIPYEKCHIGMFDVSMCERVVTACVQLKQSSVA